MPAEANPSRRWDSRPRRRSPRGGGGSGPSSGDRRSVGGRAWGACRTPARGGPRRWGAPWPGVRLTGGAGSEVGEDLVDHRRLRDEGDDAHRAVAGGTRERVDLEDLLEERRPPAGGLRRRESGRRGDGGWPRPVCGGERRLVPRAPRAVGIPAIVPRGDVALVGDVHQHPGQERERVDGLGARRRALGLVRPVRHRRGGAVVGQPLQCDGIPRTVPGESGGERAIVLRHP